MKKALKILAIIATVMVTVLPLAACSDSSKTQSELDLLKETIEELTDRLDDLTAENGELTDKINGLNVFTSDKAEYEEHETMTIFFKNVPVLKLRIDFTNIYGTAVWSGSFNFSVFITALCADIYDESIIGTAFIAWDNGYCLRGSATPDLIKRNVETMAGGYFVDTVCKQNGQQQK